MGIYYFLVVSISFKSLHFVRSDTSKKKMSVGSVQEADIENQIPQDPVDLEHALVSKPAGTGSGVPSWLAILIGVLVAVVFAVGIYNSPWWGRGECCSCNCDATKRLERLKILEEEREKKVEELAEDIDYEMENGVVFPCFLGFTTFFLSLFCCCKGFGNCMRNPTVVGYLLLGMVTYGVLVYNYPGKLGMTLCSSGGWFDEWTGLPQCS